MNILWLGNWSSIFLSWSFTFSSVIVMPRDAAFCTISSRATTDWSNSRAMLYSSAGSISLPICLDWKRKAKSSRCRTSAVNATPLTLATTGGTSLPLRVKGTGFSLATRLCGRLRSNSRNKTSRDLSFIRHHPKY